MYRPQRILLSPGASPEVVELVKFLTSELEIISKAFVDFENLQLKKLYNEPAKPRDGIVVYADGTEWNPGSGEGYYGYYGSAWRKLG